MGHGMPRDACRIAHRLVPRLVKPPPGLRRSQFVLACASRQLIPYVPRRERGQPYSRDMLLSFDFVAGQRTHGSPDDDGS